MTLKQEIQEMIDRFHERVENDPELRREVAEIEKTVTIDLGEEIYSFVLENGRVHSFEEEGIEGSDIRVTSDRGTLRGLLNGDIGPMKALALRKLRLKGDMGDLMKFRKFF